MLIQGRFSACKSHVAISMNCRSLLGAPLNKDYLVFGGIYVGHLFLDTSTKYLDSLWTAFQTTLSQAWVAVGYRGLLVWVTWLSR